jgi:glycosyltransferase involved in cell wall biosynthesis
LIKRERISLIRAQDPYAIGLLGILLGVLTRVPCCISIHADYDKCYELDGLRGAPVYFGSRKLAKRLERFVLSHAKMVMPIRESLGKSAVANGARPEVIRLIPHGVDLSPFLQDPNPDFKREWGLEGKRLVVFVGRLSKGNYVYDVLEIAKVIRGRYLDVVFAMLGDGSEAESLKLEVEANGLSRYVQILGFQPREVVVGFRQNADVNICLMGGFSLIEAAAAGRPIVSYDVEWHHELVRNGETGFLVPEREIGTASEAIIKLLDEPELGNRLGGNARELAIARHSLEMTSRIKVKWYEELMQSGG